MIVAQNTTGAWYQVTTALAPADFFEELRAREEDDRLTGRSTWVPVQPLEGFRPFGPETRVARIRLEHVTLFGIAED